MLFDFSDHIVLNMVQYMLPCVLEAHLCLVRVFLNGSQSYNAAPHTSSHTNSHNHSHNPTSANTDCDCDCDCKGASSGTGGHQSSTAGVINKTPIPIFHQAYVSLLAAIIIIVLNLKAMVLTCMFFHTTAENFVGFAVAAIVAFLPLYNKQVGIVWVRDVLNLH